MKNFVSLIVLLLTILGCDDSFYSNERNEAYIDEYSDTSNYYWYNGEKIFLMPNDTNNFVLYKNSDISINDCKWMYSRNLKALSNDSIIYTSPLYINNKGEIVALSHLFYVKLKSEEDTIILSNVAGQNKVKIVEQNEYLPLWFTLSCSKESSDNSLHLSAKFFETGLFEAVEPAVMAISTTSLLPHKRTNDPLNIKQWNLDGHNSINWYNAYKKSNGENVTIAIIDQGIEERHPDMDIPYTINRIHPTLDYDYKIFGNHGTACAGIIAAHVNNKKGIAGIAPKAKLLNIAHPLEDRPNICQELAKCLIIAANRADVISCSWKSLVPSKLIEDALSVPAFTWGRNGKGCVVVFSVGNDDLNRIAFPARCNSSILTVGAIGKNGKRCSFSNYGKELDVVAPGILIPTTDRLGYDGYDSKSDYYMAFDGTSAACPHVAGVVALMLSVNPDLTNKEVCDIIESTAQKVGGYNYSYHSERPNGSWNQEMGYGLIDAGAAVTEAIKRISK